LDDITLSPELIAALERRFGRSRHYFETIDKPLVNSWYEWESRDGAFSLIDSGERDEPKG
jgi:hypothetical protein